jgi:ABC-type bacteriocin/lantibiotic exporter with double-glycine peptidase domain
MNQFDDRLDRKGTAAETARNAVLEQQRRLAAEFEATSSEPSASPEATSPFARMLCEVLASVGWEDKQHRIFEALPHLGPILSVRMLRAVLARLDVSLIPIDRHAADLTSEDLPCLLADDSDSCHLITLGTQGEFEIYDLSGTRSKMDRCRSPGTVHLIRPRKSEELPARAPFGGFVGHVLKHLREPISRITGYSVAINALGLMLSLYVLLVFDVVIATSSLDTLAFLASGALIALGLELWLRQARSKTIAYLAARFDAVVSVRALASVLNLPLGMTERAPIASQLSRFRQFEIGRELFAGNFASALFDLPFTLLFVILLFLIGGFLGFVPIGLSIVIVTVCVLSAAVNVAQITKVNANKLKSDALLFELTDKLRTIRNAGAERIWLARYADSLATYQRSRVDNLQLGSHLQSTTNALVALAGIVTLAVGALRVMNDAMSLGELIAAMMIVWRVLVPIQVVSLNIARLKQTLSTVRQINELVRLGVERESEVPPTLSRRLDGHIYASGVYLSLGAQQEPPLRGVNLEVKAGEIVAITGPSGSGKSTLLKVILGLYPQYMGTVRLGGLDLRQLHPAEARTAIGYASQQLAFFYGSIAANFRFACPSATDADIIEALAAVGVSLPTQDLPDGLETRISGTNARSLSQGWLCRLSIARALVKKPAILLLDDPGNGLDQAGDAAFMAHLNALRGKSTVLWVTARPSHMRMANRVVEMRGGAVVADGKPEVVVPRILARLTPAA